MPWFNAEDYIVNRNPKVISKYNKIFRKGILLDTTPLLILFLGKYDKENGTKLLEGGSLSINEGSYNNRKLNVEDFELLRRFLTGLSHLKFEFFITPHIFTETIQHIWKEVRNKDEFKTIIDYIFKDYPFIEECHICCKKICGNEYLQNKRLEVGDISLMIENKKDSKAIISIDWPLISIFEKNGFLVIPFQILTTLKYTISV